MLVDPVVKQDAHNARRDAGDERLQPQEQGLLAENDPACSVLPLHSLEGPDGTPEPDYDRQDRAELDDHQKEVPEFR